MLKFCWISPKNTFKDYALYKTCDLSDVIEHTKYGTDLVTTGGGVSDLIAFNKNDTKDFYLAFLSVIRDYDYVVVDLPPGYSEKLNDFFISSDFIIAVTTIEPTSLVNTYTFLKVLMMKGVLGSSIHIVANMVNNDSENRRIMDRFTSAIEKFVGERPASITMIKEHSMVRKSVYERTPFLYLCNHCQPSYAIYRIVEQITKQRIGESSGFFKKIVTSVFGGGKN